MQHRQPRLGDILDDYCPRERRITNHAVVAMVGPDIKQTRCTTCDAEHEYKHAKVPSTRRKKEAPAALYKQVLTAAQPEALRAAESGQPPAEQPAEPAVPPPAPAAPVEPERAAAAEAPAPPVPEDEPGIQPDENLVQSEPGDDEGPVHRRLIRATLPRPEGPVQRPVPQFTVRQPGKFGGNARGAGRPPGGGTMTRMRPSPSRGAFGRNGTRDTFTTRPSGGPHHAMQRPRPGHRPAGRPARHGKKSPK
jgi:hypothetical protein